MDSSLLPLLAATATAAGIFGWLTTQPRAPPAAELDGGGFVGDMYDAAARNVAKATKATTNMVTNAFAHKDEYKQRAAEQYQRMKTNVHNGEYKQRAAEQYKRMQSSALVGKQNLDEALERIKRRA